MDTIQDSCSFQFQVSAAICSMQWSAFWHQIDRGFSWKVEQVCTKDSQEITEEDRQKILETCEAGTWKLPWCFMETT